MKKWIFCTKIAYLKILKAKDQLQWASQPSHDSPFGERSLAIGGRGGGGKGRYYFKSEGPKLLAPIRLTAQNSCPLQICVPQKLLSSPVFTMLNQVKKTIDSPTVTMNSCLLLNLKSELIVHNNLANGKGENCLYSRKVRSSCSTPPGPASSAISRGL